MSELLQKLETEIRYAMGIGAIGKTPFHNEILAIAADAERKDATIKALADALEVSRKNEREGRATTIRDRMAADAALRLAGRL